MVKKIKCKFGKVKAGKRKGLCRKLRKRALKRKKPRKSRIGPYFQIEESNW